MKIARAIVFDVRNANEATHPHFISSAEALHEVSLLSHAGTCSNFAFLSLVLLGEKGYELLLNTYPLIEIDPSLKRAFGKLKQLLKISNENAIYSSRKPIEIILSDLVSQFKQCEHCQELTQLEIVIVTATDGDKILKELDAFLFNNTNCPELNQVVVFHVTPSGMMQNQMALVSAHDQIVWRTLGDEGDTETFFKSWLVRKRKNWNLEMRSDGQCVWTSRIDIEDLMFDVKGWPYRISANFKETDGIGTFENGNNKTLEIIKWVRSDGVPAWLMYGMPRRLLPSSDLAHDDIVFKINNEQFFSLSRWLAKEGLVATVKMELLQAIDYFILTPGSDGSLLMRSIAPRELILPASTRQLSVSDSQDNNDGLFTEREVCFEQIQSAYLQLPAHTFSRGEKSRVVEAVEFHTITDIQCQTKPIVTRQRKARR